MEKAKNAFSTHVRLIPQMLKLVIPAIVALLLGSIFFLYSYSHYISEFRWKEMLDRRPTDSELVSGYVEARYAWKYYGVISATLFGIAATLLVVNWKLKQQHQSMPTHHTA
jgi:hypothetical protein